MKQLLLKKQLAELLKDQSVLVVEPSNNYRASIKQFLTNLKVKRMKLVGSVTEAKRELLTSKVGLFISEWTLAETNGIQFCRDLRKDAKHRSTPFILLSTENLRKDVVLAAEVKINGYLLKPFSYEQFCTHLSTIIDGHLNPSASNVLLETAEQKLQEQDFMAAESLFYEALSVKNGSARALTGLGKVKNLRGQHREALDLLKRAVNANPDYLEPLRVMLDIYELLGDRRGVLGTATALVELSPENPRYTLLLAKCYLEMKMLTESETYFRKTVVLSPKIAEAYKGLGHVYMIQHEYDKAMKNFKKALDLDGDDIGTLNSLGMAYVRMGKYQDGVQKYLLALKLDPQDPRVLFNIGYAYEKQNDTGKARLYYSQSLARQQGFAKAVRGIDRLNRMKDANGSPSNSSDQSHLDDEDLAS